MKLIQAPVLSNLSLSPHLHLLWVEAREMASLAQPGQFVMVRCSDDHEPLLRRPFSLHRKTSTRLAFLAGVVGRGSRWLAQRKRGDLLDLLGPLGKGFSIDNTCQRLLLIAGGVGIAPLVALAEEALARHLSVTLLLGAGSAAEIYPLALLPAGLQAQVTTEDGSAGARGLVTELLPGFLEGADQVFACGPPSLYKALATITAGRPVQVSWEQHMGCGFGACLGCVVETKDGFKRVCIDGPVFSLNELQL